MPRDRPTLFYLELLQDNDGFLYWFLYHVNTGRCANFKFWEFLEVMDNVNFIFDLGDIPDCEDCPYREDYDGQDED